jgi:glutamate carboxypeptidase
MNPPAGVRLFSFFKSIEPQMIEWLMELVNTDTPTTSKQAVDKLGNDLAAWFGELGAEVEILPASNAGNHLVVRFGRGVEGNKQLLLLGHLDTVWDIGESQKRPAKLEDGRLSGPGAFDMRGGLTLLMALARYLSVACPTLKRSLTILLVSDEETGSHSARPHIQREAAQSEIVLVMEPCLPGGAVKTARKGVGYFRITARGIAAHAGADYAKGASAIEEIAHQIQELYRLNDPAQGTTVNVGTIRGGSRSNVVPDWAEIEVDLRVSTLAEGERLAKQILGIASRNPSIQLGTTGGLNRPPLERSAQVIGLFEQAKTLAGELGIELHEGSTGGGSDGCLTAAMGVPTLDGLGPDGDGPHALHEHVLISSLVPRATLLTQLVLNL